MSGQGKSSPVITPSPAPCGPFDLVGQVWKRGVAVHRRRVGGGGGREAGNRVNCSC